MQELDCCLILDLGPMKRHSGRESKKECVLCRDECESVSHTLWDCPAYSSARAHFLLKLQASLGGTVMHVLKS